jgi:CubicO group peptidase (beta-lactamase class C family)
LRNPDAQSPVGGVTSSLIDLIEWMWLNIQAQRAATQAVEMKAHESAEFYANIRQTHVAYPDAKDPAHYGFGWNTKIDPDMGLNLSHSGAFELGAATCVSLLPNENIGIIALTNGQPIGLPEGTYHNDYYQNVTISGSGSSKDPFLMRAGGGGETFVLTPYQELTFTFQTTGENADGLIRRDFHDRPIRKSHSAQRQPFRVAGAQRRGRPGDATWRVQKYLTVKESIKNWVLKPPP